MGFYFAVLGGISLARILGALVRISFNALYSSGEG